MSHVRHDAIIISGSVAGLSAAMYIARARRYGLHHRHSISSQTVLRCIPTASFIGRSTQSLASRRLEVPLMMGQPLTAGKVTDLIPKAANDEMVRDDSIEFDDGD
jgi:hypothetical protein